MGEFFAILDEELTLYVKQSAWLNTTPDKPQTKGKHDNSDEPEPSRREMFRKQGFDSLEMPSCDAQYVINYLFEIGPTAHSGMGESPISQSDIWHWQANTGIELSAWEARILRSLSLHYMSESYKAKTPNYPAPWQDADYVKSTPSRKAETLRNSLRALAAL